MHLHLHGNFPEGLGMYFIQHGKRIELSQDTPVEVDVAEGETITLAQDPPLSWKWKALAALGILLTAPLQAALFFGENEWNDVIPYRLRAVLRPSKDASCTVQVTPHLQKLHPPKLKVLGDGVSLESSTCEATPQVLDQAYFIFLCRVVGITLWTLALLGTLLWVAVTRQIDGAVAICAVVCLGVLLACGYICIHNHKVLRRNLEILEQISNTP